MIGKLKEALPLSGGEWLVSFTTRVNPGQIFDDLKDQEVRIEIKKASGKRSIDASRFCWAMCTDIGNALRPPVPKEEVYRRAIREVGKYSMMLMQNDAVPLFQDIWSQRGTGWFAEVIDDSKKNPGCKVIFAYYGTSTYTVDEMSLVLDWLKDNMEQMGLPIPLSKGEEQRMLEQWVRGKAAENGKAS